LTTKNEENIGRENDQNSEKWKCKLNPYKYKLFTRPYIFYRFFYTGLYENRGENQPAVKKQTSIVSYIIVYDKLNW